MSNQLALRPNVITDMDSLERVALSMTKSGYFQDAKDQAQAIVKILAGQEMGFGPFASMTGIYIIQGRPSIGANLMAAAVKASGRYNYQVAEMTDTACEIIFFEDKAECGRSRFTIEDARKAQTKNLDKFPRNMLFARAMSNGCRWYCPDIFSGAPAYTPEELGADVNEDGQVIDMKPITVTVVQPPAQPAPAPRRTDATITAELGYQPEQAPAPAKGNLPDAMRYTPDALVDKLRNYAEKNKAVARNEKTAQNIAAAMNQVLGDDEKRHVALKFLTGSASMKDLTGGMIMSLAGWLKPAYDSNSGQYAVDEMARKELTHVYAETLRANGAQPELQ